MSRVARSKARPGMIYLHFGVVTLLVTAALAWLANGEQQRSETERLAKAEAGAVAEKPGASESGSSTEREMRDSRSGGSWGADPRPPRFDDGVPVTMPRRQRTQPAERMAMPPRNPDLLRPPYLEGANEPVQGTLAEVPQATPSPTPEQIEEMLRRSAQRAGGADRPPEL